MLCPPCLHRAQQLNQRRICIWPAYLSFYQTVYPSGDRTEFTPLTEMDTDGLGGGQCDTISRTNMGTMCANGGVDIFGYRSKSNTEIKQGCRQPLKKPTRVQLCRNFCWHSTSQTKWHVTVCNIILIYYLILPSLSDGVIMHYEIQ